MLSLLNNKAWIGISLFVAASSFLFGISFNKMTSDRKIAELRLEHQTEISDHEQTLIEIENQAQAELARQQTLIDQANSKYLESVTHAKTKIDQLLGELDSNKRMLSTKVKSCVSTTKTINSGSTITETRAELDSGTSESLIRITSRCDNIALQLNALIEAVN